MAYGIKQVDMHDPDHPHTATWAELDRVRAYIIGLGNPSDYEALWQLIVTATKAHGNSALTAKVIEGNAGKSWAMIAVLWEDRSFDPRPLLSAMQMLSSTIKNS